MFKHIWTKFKALIGGEPPAEVAPTPASQQEMDVAPKYSPKETKPLPKTLGDMIAEETGYKASEGSVPVKMKCKCGPNEVCPDCPKSPVPTPAPVCPPPTPPKPPKKPRRPRVKKVPPSPEVVAVYQDPPAPPAEEKLDTRLDGHATKPRKPRKKKE